MKRLALFSAIVLSVIFFTTSSYAQTTGTDTGKGTRINWVDVDGDGICDNFGTDKQGVNATGKGYGKKDGTGTPVKPQDGTGFGKKGGNSVGAGSGSCDGTGPKGSAKRSGRK